MSFRITLFHVVFWTTIFLYHLFISYVRNKLYIQYIYGELLFASVNASATYGYAYILHTTLFFRRVPYKYQLATFLIFVFLFVLFLTLLNIKVGEAIFAPNRYQNLHLLFIDFFILSFNQGRFILVCLLGHHTYFLFRQVLEERAIQHQLRLQALSIQQEALKLQIAPIFLTNTFHILEETIGKDKTEARKILSLLSDVLRNALSYEKSALRPLSEEIEAAQKYLHLTTYQETIPFQIASSLALHDISSMLLPANTLLAFADFVLHEGKPPLYLALDFQPQVVSISLHFIPTHAHVQARFTTNPYLQNLRQLAQQRWGEKVQLAYQETGEESCLLMRIKGSLTL